MAVTTSVRIPPAEWAQVFAQARHGLTKALAETILALDFTAEEKARMLALGTKANRGTISVNEDAELETMVTANLELTYWRLEAEDFLFASDE